MKWALSILLAAGTLVCCSPALAQANCSYLAYTLTSDTKLTDPNCDTHLNQTVTETRSYSVQCVDQTNNNNIYFNATSQQTATGQTSLFCGATTQIDCSPRWEPQNVNAGFTTATDNVNQFFLRFWPRTRSGSQCADGPPQQDFKQCAAVPCPTAGNLGGGGSDPPPGGCGGSGGTSLGDGSGGTGCSPIILDIGNEGFHLTSAQGGVSFDIAGTGHLVQIAWTDSHFRNAFLALPGPDGLVHNGKELFGNFTPQPKSAAPNGFLALAEFDKPENGGNGDGIIDDRDAVFSRLMLWIDENHDGISQPSELHSLPSLGVTSISLDYHVSRRTDQFGNIFRYRAKVDPASPQDRSDVGPTAYDVFLATPK